MTKHEQKIYKFHLKMDSEMRQILNNVPLLKKVGSISQKIVKILVLLSPGMEKMHLEWEQQYSRYEFVCPDKKTGRKSVYVYLSETEYRKLKSMHQDLNFYSMAQLLRLMLRFFLVLVTVYGNGVESKLLELYRRWKKEREQKKYEWKPVEELLHSIFQKRQVSWLLTLYDRKFQPINIYRL